MKITTTILMLACTIALVSPLAVPHIPRGVLLDRRMPVEKDELSLMKRAPRRKKGKKSASKKSDNSKESKKSDPIVPESSVNPLVADNSITDSSSTTLTEEDIADSLSAALELCKWKEEQERAQCSIDADYEAFLKVCNNEEQQADKTQCITIAQEDRDAEQSVVDAKKQAAVLKAELEASLQTCNQAASDGADETTTINCNLDAFHVAAQAAPECSLVVDTQTCIVDAYVEAAAQFTRKVDRFCASVWNDFTCIEENVIISKELIGGIGGAEFWMPSGDLAEATVGTMSDWASR
jgi:hypothetical protein